MTPILRGILFVGLALCATVAGASYHTFEIDEIYSNADGTVQYVVLHESIGANGESFLTGHLLTSTGPAGTANFTFPRNLPGGDSCDGYGMCTPSPTAGARVLIATEAFAGLGLITPDYVVPNGFLAPGGGTLNYAGVDQWTYGPLPVDGVSALYRSGSVSANSAMNFNGDRVSVTLAGPAAPNYQGLWWKTPAESESGWGINFAHQADTIFASWFTYDLSGRGWWLVMTATKTGPGTYDGDLFETTGPAFNAQPFNPAMVTRLKVGSGNLTFSDANNGTLDYTINSIHQVAISPVHQEKAITRQAFGPLPACVYGSQPNLALATNYQDLWWNSPAESESGWGINLTHEGDNIFVTWFTYDLDGTPMWLSGTAAKTPSGTYTGDLYRTTGPAFNAVPFNPAAVGRVKVGTLTFTFANGNSAMFEYTVQYAPLPNPVHQTKTIIRQVFAAPGTACQ